MNRNEQPSIAFESVSLESASFKATPDFEKPEGPIEVGLNFNIDRQFSDDGKKLHVTLNVTVQFPESKKPPMELTVTVSGTFKLENEEHNDFFVSFSNVQAAALLFPYAREIISNLTGKSKLPMLLLPPVNLEAMLAPQEEPPEEGIASENTK